MHDIDRVQLENDSEMAMENYEAGQFEWSGRRRWFPPRAFCRRRRSRSMVSWCAAGGSCGV